MAKTTTPLTAQERNLIENNDYAVIGVDHFAQADKSAKRGTVRIYSSTESLDKTFGHFVYMVGEIGDEPGYRQGRYIKID
jgi:hypothetical protein